MDIIWLQRDLGLYVVNLFDTYHASKVLGFPAHSLAYLLKHYCHVEADKKYQLADWRIRPLPEDMLRYARSDTHFLLYIYDKMKMELLSNGDSGARNLLHATLQKSNETALHVYRKEAYDFETGRGASGWLSLYGKYNKPLTKRSFEAFKALHRWRDEIAREEDESTRYVLPNHMLFSIADKCPFEASQVLACCTPIPPCIRIYASDIALLMREVSDQFKSPSEANSVAHISLPKATHTRFPASNTEGPSFDAPTEEPYKRKHTDVSVAGLHVSKLIDSNLKAVPFNRIAVSCNRVKEIEAAIVTVQSLLPKVRIYVCCVIFSLRKRFLQPRIV
jgi:exosome complex exonuclease RRP6